MLIDCIKRHIPFLNNYLSRKTPQEPVTINNFCLSQLLMFSYTSSGIFLYGFAYGLAFTVTVKVEDLPALLQTP